MKCMHWRAIAAAVVTAALLPLMGSSAFAQAPLSESDLAVLNWRHIGPWTFSGRITEFAVPPGQNKIWYALTASGGLFKTEDHGISFQPLFENYGNMSMGYLGIAPSNPDILYLGTGEPMHARSSARGNGVWKSTDAGRSWVHVGLEQSYFINKVEVHPTNPDIVYVAAEGKLYDNEPGCQRGLYKTTDGGRTWTNVFPVTDRGVGDFVMDPTRPDVIVAAAYKIYRRAWTYIDRQEGNWLYKTTDGGRTWKRLENGLPLDLPMGRAGLALYPRDTRILYARLDELVSLGLSESPGAARFRSGQLFRDGWFLNRFRPFTPNRQIARMVNFTPPTWNTEAELVNALNALVTDPEFAGRIGADPARLNAEARRIWRDDADLMAAIAEIEKTIASSPATDNGRRARSEAINRHVLELLYAPALGLQRPVTREGVVYRSDDQGESWRRMTEYSQQGGSTSVNDTEAGYYGRLAVDPNNPEVLYACNTTVKKSTDGGRIFQNVRWTGQHRTHVDTRGLWVDPLDSNHILNANDGAASETWDGGLHWSQKETIPAQQFYDISVDNQMPYNVMGGTQDNGAWIGPSRNRNQYGVFPADWTYLPTGDGFYVVRDWWNPEWIYFESQFGASRRMNLNTGETVSLTQRTSRQETEEGVPAQRYQWDAPIVLSPHNPGIVYIASQNIWRSESRGDPGSWVKISPDLSRADPHRIAESRLTNLQYATVYTFAESPLKPGLFWAGTDDGNLQLSQDGGRTWTNITFTHWTENGRQRPNIAGDRLPFDRWVMRVTPSAHDVNTCYVAFSGYRTHNEDVTWLYMTTDLGKSWKDIGAGMKSTANDILEDPDNPDVLYLGSDYGLFVSIDRGGQWIRMAGRAPDVIIMDLEIQKRERELAIGTYGRGIYLADIGPIAQLTPEVLAADAYLFEPQRAVQWNMFERRGPTYGEFARTPNPPVEAPIYYWLKGSVESAQLVVSTLDGRNLAEINGSTGAGLQRVAWNMRAGRGGFAGGGRGGAGGGLEPGSYRVTLSVNGSEVATHLLRIEADPMFK